MKGNSENFADRMLNAIDEKRSAVVAGLDPRIERLPVEIRMQAESKYGKGRRGAAMALWLFNKEIIDAVEPYVVAVKPQLAFYEIYGSEGIKALERTIAYAGRRGLIVINDAKRGDIGSTAAAYAAAHIGSGSLSADAVTVNAYLGTDGVTPFVDACTGSGRGVFVLVKTSNPSAADLQDLPLSEGCLLYQNLARRLAGWGASLTGKRGYSAIGAVVAGTYPGIADDLRTLLPEALFLVPGYGSQGADADDVTAAFGPDGYGAVVNSSRAILFPSGSRAVRLVKKGRFAQASAEAARDMRDAINNALRRCGRLPSGW